MKRIVIACLAALVFGSTHAETTVAEYERIKAASGNDWKSMIVYIVGVTAGISWSNAHLKINGKTPMFCLPASLRTNADFDIKILEAEIQRIRKNPNVTDDTAKIEPSLLYGFIHTYPCK